MSDFAEISRLMAEAEQAMVPADLKAKGWIYKDLPGRWTHAAWNLILDLMGDGEYQCIAMISGIDKHGVAYKRGQFFISPQGMNNFGDADKLVRLRDLVSIPQGSGK